MDNYLNVDGFEWFYFRARGWVLDADGVQVSVRFLPDGIWVDNGVERFRWSDLCRSDEDVEDVLRDVALWALS